MGVHRFARARDDIQSKLIDMQGHKSITDAVKIRTLRNNMADIIKKAIIPHRTDDMIYNEIVSKSAQFEPANRGANTEHTTLVYSSKVSRDTNAANTCLC